jgi:hypothetical protein
LNFSEEEEDDLGDFVVYGEDEQGRPIKRKKKRSTSRISNTQLRAAADIFGEFDEFLDTTSREEVRVLKMYQLKLS